MTNVKRSGRKKNANEEKLKKKRSAEKRKRSGSSAKFNDKKTTRSEPGSASGMKNGAQSSELWMSNEKRNARNGMSDGGVKTGIDIEIGDIVTEIAVAQGTGTWIEIVIGTGTGTEITTVTVTATAPPATARIVVYHPVSKTPETRKPQYQKNPLPRQRRQRPWMRRLWKRLPCSSC